MNKIITISREFGSGGREIGKRLADELGFRYYDKEIITAISKETGMSEEYIKNISEKGIYPYAFQFAKSFAMLSGLQSNQTEILVTQQKILKEIASKGNCIIVGRGANIILKEYNPMNIFVYADMESKINRCRIKRKDEEITDKEIKNKIMQIDKNRINYHKIISSQEWGNPKNYNLCINTTGIEIKTIISSLSSYIEEWFGGK
ncbi:MAG: cytidylate kinase-like family protein [Clostridia bacterium]|nr:cytidylate kinase-like family protein [Clostridia bacterium]